MEKKSFPTQLPGNNSKTVATTEYVDSLPVPNPGTAVGAAFSLVFDGTSTLSLYSGGRVAQSILNALITKGNQQFTISMWLKYVGSPGTNNNVFSQKPVSGHTRIFWGSSTNTNAYFYFAADGNGSTNYLFWYGTDTIVTTGVWYHLVIVYYGTKALSERVNMYVNGVGQTISTITGGTGFSSFSSNSNDFYIAQAGSNTNNFNGKICEICFWDDLLSHDEVLALYNGGKIVNPTKARGAYNSNDKVVMWLCGNNVRYSAINPIIFDAVNQGSYFSQSASLSGKPGYSTDVPS